MTIILRRSATMFTTPSDRELVATHIVRAPRRRVFEAHVRPEQVQQWMLGPEGWAMPLCEIDPRPGGNWRYAWRRPNGVEMEMCGTFCEITPPSRIVNTEAWGGGWPDTLNTTILLEDSGRTTITCRVLYPSMKAREAARSTGMEAGWARSYELLDEYLASAPARGEPSAGFAPTRAPSGPRAPHSAPMLP